METFKSFVVFCLVVYVKTIICFSCFVSVFPSCLILCIFIVTCFSPRADGAEINFQTALAIIKAKENEIKSISFEGKVNLSEQTGGKVKMVLDKNGRYRVEVSNSLRKIDSNELISQQYIRTYDGAVFREQSKYAPDGKDIYSSHFKFRFSFQIQL